LICNWYILNHIKGLDLDSRRQVIRNVEFGHFGNSEQSFCWKCVLVSVSIQFSVE